MTLERCTVRYYSASKVLEILNPDGSVGFTAKNVDPPLVEQTGRVHGAPPPEAAPPPTPPEPPREPPGPDEPVPEDITGTVGGDSAADES